MFTENWILLGMMLLSAFLFGVLCIPIEREIRGQLRWQIRRWKVKRLQRRWEAKRRARMVEALR